MVHSGRDAHVPPERASDALGYPALRVAHSRKVQKGEDFSFAVPDARWVVPGDDASSDPKRAVHFSAFGLFDGHGGKDCAAHCASETLPALLAALDRLGPVPRDVDPEDAFEARLPAALAAAFATLDAAFLARDIHSGATATVVVVCGRCVTTAAVGDSLATLDCTGGGPKGSKGGGAGGGGGDPHHHPPAPPHKLSPEHRLDTSASERERVLAAGAEVRATAFEDGRPVGPLRVWPGGLAVSRSIGDRDGKRGGGVISEPEVTRVVVPDEQPGFRIVLASDGLWDAATVKQSQRCSGRCATGAAAAALCKLAREQKDNRDDITVVVIDALADPEHKDPFSQRRAPWRVDVDVRAVWPEEEQQRREQRREEGSSSRAPPPPSERRRLRAEAKAAEEAVTAAEDDRGGTPEVGGPTEAAFSAKPATDASTKNRSEKNDSASLEPADDGGGWEEVGAAQKSHRPNRRGGGWFWTRRRRDRAPLRGDHRARSPARRSGGTRGRGRGR